MVKKTPLIGSARELSIIISAPDAVIADSILINGESIDFTNAAILQNGGY